MAVTDSEFENAELNSNSWLYSFVPFSLLPLEKVSINSLKEYIAGQTGLPGLG